eukprot:1694582-Prorocentrum_lima.AAC.1
MCTKKVDHNRRCAVDHNFEMVQEDKNMLKCIQCPTFKNSWKVVAKGSRDDEEVVGFFMV